MPPERRRNYDFRQRKPEKSETGYLWRASRERPRETLNHRREAMAEDKNSVSTWLTLILGIIGLLATIGMAVSGYSVHRIDAVNENVVKNYVPKDQYHKDWNTLCERLSSLDGKLDAIDKLLRDHERDSRTRRTP
jgi:hypothetical protein